VIFRQIPELLKYVYVKIEWFNIFDSMPYDISASGRAILLPEHQRNQEVSVRLSSILEPIANLVLRALQTLLYNISLKSSTFILDCE